MADLSNPLYVPERFARKNGAQPSAQDELELLRSFYLAWEALHAVPKAEKQAAAETLVRISHAIKAHRG